MEDTKQWPNIRSATSDCNLLFNICLELAAESETTDLLGGYAAKFIETMREHQGRFDDWSLRLRVFAEQERRRDHLVTKSKELREEVLTLLDLVYQGLKSLLSLIERRHNAKKHEVHQTKTYTETLLEEIQRDQKYVAEAIERLHDLGEDILYAPIAALMSRRREFPAKASDPSLEEVSQLMVKFLYPTAALSLQKLLGESILERHFSIYYKVAHHRDLATRRSLTLDEDQSAAHNEDTEPQEPVKINGKDSPTAACDNSEMQTDTMHSESGSKPSTIQANHIYPNFRFGQQLPALSAVSTFSSVLAANISYPKPPKPQGDGKFSRPICFWCSETYPCEKFQDPKWWRRHVDHDLQPYVCLIDTCSISNRAFDRFSLWIEHMEKHHSPNWIARMNRESVWQCCIDHESPEHFSDEASLRDHIREHHRESFDDDQIVRLVRRSVKHTPGSEEICPLCRFDFGKALVVDQPTDFQPSSPSKRKRGVGDTVTKLDARPQKRNTKGRFQDQGEIKDIESISSDELDPDPTSDPAAESTSPQPIDRLERKQLLFRHIETHLKALSFLSLRLSAFHGPFESGDQSSAIGNDHDNTSKRAETSGMSAELGVLSPTFTGEGVSPAGFESDLANDLGPQQQSSAISGDSRSADPQPVDSDLDLSAGDSIGTAESQTVTPVLITPLQKISDPIPIATQSNSWIQSVELFVQKNIESDKLNDGTIKILLIDHWVDMNQLASVARRSDESPVRQDMLCNYLEDARGSLIAQMIHRMCPHTKLFMAKSGGIDQSTKTDGAERAAKAIEWAIKQDVQIILLTGNLIVSKENNEGIMNLDKQIQQAAAANILLYCTAADGSSYSDESELFPHRFDKGFIRVVGSATEAGTASQSVEPGQFDYLFPGEVLLGIDGLNDSSVATALAAGFAALILKCFAQQPPRRPKNGYEKPDADGMHKIFKELQKGGKKLIDVTTLFKMDGSAAIQTVVDKCYAAGRNKRRGRGRL